MAGLNTIHHFSSTNINYTLCSDLNIPELENLCLEIRKPRSRPFLGATCYRPPNSSTEIFSHFESLVGKLDAENAEFYLMGNMNCNLATSHLDHNVSFPRNIAAVIYQTRGRVFHQISKH